MKIRQFGKKDEIYIPLTDRSIYFGDAVYDAAVGRYDRIMWEDEHIDRFFANTSRIGIKLQLSKKDFASLLHEVAIKSMIENYFIYFQASRCLNERVHSYSGSYTSLLITVSPFTMNNDKRSLNLVTFKDMRYGYCDIKTVNLLPAVLASTKAKELGCDEAVFVRQGIVTEGAKSNIAIIKRGRVITHPKNNKILSGITRAHLQRACKQINIPFIEERFSVKEMFSADEILITSTTNLCKAAQEIDGKTVGGNARSVAKALSDVLYNEYKSICTN